MRWIISAVRRRRRMGKEADRIFYCWIWECRILVEMAQEERMGRKVICSNNSSKDRYVFIPFSLSFESSCFVVRD